MSNSERAIEELLSRSSVRPEPPADVRGRVLAAVEAEWHASKRKRRWPAVAAAAAVVVAVFAGLLMQAGTGRFEVELAQTRSLSLDGATYESGGTMLAMRAGSTMLARSASRLVGADGTELRMRADTEMTWSAPDQVTLSAGALYVNTHGRSGFRITTPAGVVEDIGTTFMVTVVEDEVEVALREGAVRIDTEQGRLLASTDERGGDVLLINAAGATRRRESTAGTRWDWIHEAHPGYRESSVPRLLALIARDLGQGLDYASPGVLASIENARMAGDISALPPQEALRVVLATNGLVLLPEPQNRMVVAFQTPPQTH